MEYFDHGSSPVDWCEGNYEVVTGVAEFFNTVSNIPFLIVPAISIYLFRDYGNKVTQGVHVIFGLLISVGLGSLYFHSTLSLVGQLMDELLILWVLLFSYAILFPDQYLPKYFKRNKWQFNLIILLFCILITSLCFYRPYLNAYFLLVLSWPSFVVLNYRIKSCTDQNALSLCTRIIIIWVGSVILWILDRIFCNFLIMIGLNYFHSIFHVTAIFSAQWTATLFLYFTASDRVAHLKPTIAYWRKKHLFKLFPYVQFFDSLTTNIEDNYLIKEA